MNLYLLPKALNDSVAVVCEVHVDVPAVRSSRE